MLLQSCTRFFVCEVDKGSHTLFTKAEKNQEFISFIICKLLICPCFKPLQCHRSKHIKRSASHNNFEEATSAPLCGTTQPLHLGALGYHQHYLILSFLFMVCLRSCSECFQYNLIIPVILGRTVFSITLGKTSLSWSSSLFDSDIFSASLNSSIALNQGISSNSVQFCWKMNAVSCSAVSINRKAQSSNTQIPT